jgi:hypothetical protein
VGSVRARLGATYCCEFGESLNVTAVNTAFSAYLTPDYLATPLTFS